MRWIFIVLLMCNGIYFLWQNYLLQGDIPGAMAKPVAGGFAEVGLVLLAEVEGIPLAQTDTAEPEARPEAAVPLAENTDPSALPEPADPGICWQIGPFKEEVSGKQVVSRLASLDITLQLEALEIPGKPDYWVHLPPQVSRKAAIKLLRELQAKKIDSFLITEGELANGISLGFFTEEARANRVFEQRIKQGYGAQIKVVPRMYTELWAVFDAGEYGKFSDALWEAIKEGNKGLERRKNYCDKIASTNNFD
ncbi:MAG: SPOR domain-containing protein [Oceanicoccus sp.]|uniref:SPOR domain-containing protein n=1 Tax=Oceanicoccus sp. TaxID=2691044 RepID=UPI00263987F4|nr:hypothetical protein [Oceanicoccus sp.]MCP3909154.1 SPOR domain-containing protein [Oceanicoccus sp.]MDG1772758.1 hypothetical protein [Oceanicoccus sp.]